MLIVGGAVLLLFALLSLSTPGAVLGQKRIVNVLLGALAVSAIVFMLVRAGFAWAAIGLVLLWTAAKRLSSDNQPLKNNPRPRDSTASEAQMRRPRGSAPMTREEAYAVLGLDVGAPKERVIAEYRRLMKKVHPDQGGTTYLATRLNEAKDVLLD